jgi:hypothetical protein
MEEMRFARQQGGGSSREKGNEVLRSCKYDSRKCCVCSGASRREMSRKMAEKRVVLMLVANAIGLLAIRIIRQSL